MKNIVKILIATVGFALIFAACQKEGILPYYKTGNVTVMTNSATTVKAAIADSSKTAFTVSWSWPNYATDSINYKFIVQIDSAGKNFVKPYTKVVKGVLHTTFTAKELNSIVFGFGGTGAPYTLETRVVSSYANNNEQYISNVSNVIVTPYIIPVVLTLNPVGPLTLVMGNAANKAVTFKWNTAVFGNLPLNYAIQIDKANGTFTAPLVLPYGTALTGDITVVNLNRAAINAGIAANTTGDLAIRVMAYQGANFKNPLYSNVATLKVTTYLDIVKFWVVGAYNGWDNSDNALFIMNTPTTGANAEGYINFDAEGAFKFTTDHSWDDAHTFGDDGAKTGKLSNVGGGKDIALSPAGYYLLKANPLTMTYSALKTTWGIIGNATPGSWDNDTQMSYDPATKLWTVHATLTQKSAPNDGLKFRANGNWDLNYGDTGADGSLEVGGTNISIPFNGDYAIVLDLSHPQAYTYSLTSWGLIGDATPGGWSTDTPMTWNNVNKVWTTTVVLTSGGGAKTFKFRANQGWTLNYGGNGTGDGTADNYTTATTAPLAAGGKNLGVPGQVDGTYTVSFDPISLIATVTQN